MHTQLPTVANSHMVVDGNTGFEDVVIVCDGRGLCPAQIGNVRGRRSSTVNIVAVYQALQGQKRQQDDVSMKILVVQLPLPATKILTGHTFQDTQ